MDNIDKDSLCREALRELDEYFLGRQNDIKRGAETPAISGLMFEKFAWGLSKGLKYLDRVSPGRPTVSAVVQSKADELVLELDPVFRKNKQKRWQSHPVDIAFNITKE